MKVFLILLLTYARSQEVPTPSSKLKPRDFNPHSYLETLDSAEPTKQGPVVFPNDVPPPPRPPLIVTSRPLLESIARSELADNSSTSLNTVTSQSQNTVTSQSQDRVSFVPFLARVKDYRPYNPSPTFDYQASPTGVPYADLLKKARFNNLLRDNGYNDYEERTALPPIYKAQSNHAQQKVLKTQEHYQPKPVAYARPYQSNDINEENSEYDQNQNYAFSYTVKDQKTGDDFSHSQQSSGSATNGEYRVRLPDGRMQIVSYTADENGYNADVRYDDEENAGNTVDDGYNQRNDHGNQQKSYDNKHNKYDIQQNKYAIQQNNYDNQLNKYDNLHNKYDIKQVNYDNQNNYQPKYNYVTVRPQNYVTPNYFVTPQNNNYANQQTDYSKIVDYTDKSNKHDYDITDKREKLNDKAEKDYYQYPDVSKEYYNDYSSEYNNNYEPHRSKFNFVDNKNVEITNTGTASTVKPSYEELKDLFVSKSLYNTKQNYDTDYKNPSTTPISLNDEDRVVNIGGKTPNLYTNIKHSLPLYNVTPIPIYPTPKVGAATTPKTYLVSTIANLKNKVSLGTKPVLSDNFISRINKYINFN